MTKGNGVTHFTELHRTLHKNFLIWRWPSGSPFSFAVKRAAAPLEFVNFLEESLIKDF